MLRDESLSSLNDEFAESFDDSCASFVFSGRLGFIDEDKRVEREATEVDIDGLFVKANESKF